MFSPTLNVIIRTLADCELQRTEYCLFVAMNNSSSPKVCPSDITESLIKFELVSYYF